MEIALGALGILVLVALVVLIALQFHKPAPAESQSLGLLQNQLKFTARTARQIRPDGEQHSAELHRLDEHAVGQRGQSRR